MSSMSLFTIVTAVVALTSVAALVFAMPSIVNPAVPLGVNIPLNRVHEPVVNESIRRYRQAVVVSYVLCLVLVCVMALFVPALAPVIPLLAFVVLQTVAYVVTRRPIQIAKSHGGWYDGVPVRRSAVIDQASAKAPVPVGWYVMSFLVLAVVVSAGVILYPRLPHQIPTHWNAAGEINSWAPKSIWSAFGPLVIALGLNALFLGISCAIRAGIPMNLSFSTADNHNASAARAASVFQRLLGAIALTLTVLISVLNVHAWVGKSLSGLMMAIMLVVPLVIIVAVAVVPIMAFRQRKPESESRKGDLATAPSSPDDDHFWKAGMVYVNRKNSSLMVPKRFGVGWTINFGHPAGIAIMVGLLLVVVASIALPALLR